MCLNDKERSLENCSSVPLCALPYGSRSCAAALRLVRFEPPVVEEVVAPRVPALVAVR